MSGNKSNCSDLSNPDDVRVPEQLQRAMAAEAEAAREARAKVIAAEGEHKASRALRHAAEIIMDNPAALQVKKINSLCYLQERFFLVAEVSSDSEQYISRKQQHNCIPSSYRCDLWDDESNWRCSSHAATTIFGKNTK